MDKIKILAYDATQFEIMSEYASYPQLTKRNV